MKATLKNKWLLGVSLFLSAATFTSCDNDDEVVVQIPENFAMDLSSLNIAWDETEGVVELAANDEWKAQSGSGWISIDPSKGNPGDFRMFLNFEPNPYRLPRTGSLTVVCGEQTGVITVTQAGCTDDSKVAPCAANLEVESLDYASGEISFATFSEMIEGNLGLSLAEFGQGVDDDGNLEFFMVDKAGNWIEGGTAGTRCSAWLDADLNVTNWDGAGYPAIATFLEVYGGEDPTLVIGRAPGVPDNAEYTLNFGFTFKDDHSKYCIFKIDVVFPAMDLKGELVATHDIDVTVIANDGYQAYPAVFDAAEVCAELGCNSLDLVKVVAYDEEGEFVGYTAGNGYWYMPDGSIGNWGEGAGWFIEYWGDGPDSEDYSSWAVGPFPGVNNVSATSQIGFWYNAKVVMFNVNVTVTE